MDGEYGGLQLGVGAPRFLLATYSLLSLLYHSFRDDLVNLFERV